MMPCAPRSGRNRILTPGTQPGRRTSSSVRNTPDARTATGDEYSVPCRFILCSLTERLVLPLNCGCGKAIGQECADQIERLRGGCQPPDPSREAMDHAFPHVHACIDARGECPFDEADRVIEKYFVVAHMHTDRREAGQVGMGRR